MRLGYRVSLAIPNRIASQRTCKFQHVIVSLIVLLMIKQSKLFEQNVFQMRLSSPEGAVIFETTNIAKKLRGIVTIPG